MSGRERRRVLVLVPGALGERLSGPEIRAWEFAKALRHDHEVTVAAKDGCGEREGIPVVAFDRLGLLREGARHDAVLSAALPPYLLALKSRPGFLAITDQYDPHELELATLAPGRQRERELRARAALQALQLRHADLVMCAAESQREELIRTAARLGPGAHAVDPVVVPFGIDDAPARSARRPLHERFSQLAEGDTIVLWWGSIWRWLDAETAVRAFASLHASRPDIKLVITAGRPPNKSAERFFDATEEARALAGELGVLGRTVLFFDDWIPYEQRHDYLHEADIGLTLHRHAEEARLAARARYMDYLSAELPCVLGRGDEAAEEFGTAGFATLLDGPDPDRLAGVLLALADDPAALLDARAAGSGLAAQRRWSAVGETLRAAVAGASTTPPSLALFGDSGAYYVRRAVDRVLVAR